MAHSDYNCCAVCDRKMSYVGIGAKTKTEICSTCIANLAQEGVIVHNVEELVDWAKDNNKETVKNILQIVGFHFCYYGNWVDESIEEKGIEEDKETRRIKGN